MNALQALKAELAVLDALILEQKSTAKPLAKLRACKVSARTSAKYFDLQRAYMLAVTGK